MEVWDKDRDPESYLSKLQEFGMKIYFPRGVNYEARLLEQQVMLSFKPQIYAVLDKSVCYTK